MSSRRYTIILILNVLRCNRGGITFHQLVEQVLRWASGNRVPLYLGTEWSVWDYLESLEQQGKLRITSDSGVFHLFPMGELQPEPELFQLEPSPRTHENCDHFVATNSR